jgi:hypothetical protein
MRAKLDGARDAPYPHGFKPQPIIATARRTARWLHEINGTAIACWPICTTAR